MSTTPDPFKARTQIDTPLGERSIYRLDALRGIGELTTIPYCIRVLLESCLRHCDNEVVTEEHVKALAGYDAKNVTDQEVPFTPARVILQDFTGVPAVVDLAAMRDAMKHLGGDPRKVNPQVQCDLVIDHSVQVDEFNSNVALTINSQKEFQRNRERYEFLKWGQSAFDNFKVVPPATGIVHQVNLEYLGKVVWDGAAGNTKTENTLYPDSLVGTDSHTTMINGLGIVGWGVGGIEAEAVMMGQPIYMLIPEVVGLRMHGKLAEGCTATDLVLRVTQMLREHGVVGKFVEFCGDGLDNMPVANRATIGNMSPEYGATIGFFPVDEQTLRYMRLSGRDEKLVQTVEQYYKQQQLWRDESQDIQYTDLLELDLGSVEPSLAGPKRPQDRISLSDMKTQWADDLGRTFKKDTTTLVDNPVGGWTEEGGQPPNQIGNHPNGDTARAVVAEPETDKPADPGFAGVEVTNEGDTFTLKHGSLVIAAITSCTNTSNPGVMLGAGLVAKKAREKGLTRKPWVKTSLAPGSKVVTDYLDKAGLSDELQELGFYLVGYGCTTCIGNSGPLPEPISNAINENDLVAASVLSGNRNFEGRIHPDCRANYLASPPLVVAYAIAGTVDIDLTKDPLGEDSNGNAVYLHDIWPTQKEIDDVVAACVTREQFIEQYANVFEGQDEWKEVEVTGGDLYEWDDNSTYVQNPPFFTGMTRTVEPIKPVKAARCIVKVGDSVTTDHISPAGSIKKESPAGQYLINHEVPVSQFNSYGSRRGNDQVMTRGTFANIRVRNQLAPGTEGGWTKYFGDSDLPADTVRPEKSDDRNIVSIFDAARGYGACLTSEDSVKRQPDSTPLIVLAGSDYGMGSSRDWAAKGTDLLGIRAVIATSFERIHRSNLVFMGVLPLVFSKGEDAESLKLDGSEIFDIQCDDTLGPRDEVKVTARKSDGKTIEFKTTCRIDTPVEIQYYRNGGILHTVLRKMAGSQS